MPTWRVWGEKYYTADATGTRIYQPIVFPRNTILLATRAWMVFYNNPTFTNISMLVYSDDNGAPGQLIQTATTTWNKADLYTEDNAVKEMYFEWDYPTFKAGDTFHFVINFGGYTYSESSHVAWKKTFPDPPYKLNLTLDYESLLTYPYDITFVGDQL